MNYCPQSMFSFFVSFLQIGNLTVTESIITKAYRQNKENDVNTFLCMALTSFSSLSLLELSNGSIAEYWSLLFKWSLSTVTIDNSSFTELNCFCRLLKDICWISNCSRNGVMFVKYVEISFSCASCNVFN